MEHLDKLILSLEMIGTFSFAASGALKGLHKNTDLLGVILLGIIASTGGGILRDLILGDTPPAAFRNPVYVITACLVSLFVFVLEASIDRKTHLIESVGIRHTFFLMDTLGLGIFTVMGVYSAWQMFGSDNPFLILFSGVVTGVGGGVIRDIIVNDLPYIFTKHIYATASLTGAVVCFLLIRSSHVQLGIWCGAGVIWLLRILADYYHWNLPKIRDFDR
ncbi:MAG: TRIC cation channel family protein [Solobacterium sp.]|nr:TRIC cation channel family protein [Solobacterium sp.]